MVHRTQSTRKIKLLLILLESETTWFPVSTHLHCNLLPSHCLQGQSLRSLEAVTGGPPVPAVNSQSCTELENEREDGSTSKRWLTILTPFEPPGGAEWRLQVQRHKAHLSLARMVAASNSVTGWGLSAWAQGRTLDITWKNTMNSCTYRLLSWSHFCLQTTSPKHFLRLPTKTH